MDFLNIGPVILGQTEEGVFDAQLVFAHDGQAGVPQQFVVMELRPSDGVLDGHEADGCGFLLEHLKYLLKSRATE